MGPIQLSFHGAARTVTGSKHLLTVGDRRILLDAGLFQGRKHLRLRNWSNPGFDPRTVDHVLISHTHIDHIGYLPRLVKLGLDAPVHLTPAAHALSELMLLDSAKIQVEDARRANRKGYTKHRPALPLYDTDDAHAALALRRIARYRQWVDLGGTPPVRARWMNSGHLLGAGYLELRVGDRPRELRIVFSGDIGRFEVPLHLDPRPLVDCDVLIMESTYGNRTHTSQTVAEQITEPFARALGSGGTVLIPAFAVGRSQQVTLVLRRLMKAGAIPDVPIHIDSPMAVNATRIYSRYLDKRNIDPDVYEDGRLRLFPERVQFHRKVEESKQLNRLRGPRIIVSASGMLSGGRVLHHLKRLAGDKRNLLMLAGYQAPGTRARYLLDGDDRVKIHGGWHPVRCEVMSLQGLSGHADRGELLRWVQSAKRPPKLIYLVHGDPDASEALAPELERRFGARVTIPDLDDAFDLDAALGEVG